jgi:type VI secretion system protein ImpI
MALIVKIVDPGGEERARSFETPTVRIGRNATNEIALDRPFVSQFHAQIDVRGTSVLVTDLGSTNGTSVNGHRLTARAPVHLTSPADTIQIGDLRISVSFGDEHRPDPPRVEPPSYRDRRALRVRIADAVTGRSETHVFESSPIRIGRNNLNEIVLAQGFVSQWHAILRFGADGLFVMDLGSTNGTIVNGQRLEARTPTVLRPGGDAVQVGTISIQLDFTAPVTVAVAVPALEGDGEETALFFDAARWLCALRGDGVSAESRRRLQVGPAMDRVNLLLQTFGRSYIELRNGFDQFGKEMGLEVAKETTPLRAAQSEADVLDYLVDWEAGNDRVEQLRRAYTDLALHQVALLNGVMAGVRELLQELSPQSAKGWRPFSTGDMEKKRLELLEEDRFSRVVFGKAFARAYFEVAGGKAPSDK